jgi:hypothetical protein
MSLTSYRAAPIDSSTLTTFDLGDVPQMYRKIRLKPLKHEPGLSKRIKHHGMVGNG